MFLFLCVLLCQVTLQDSLQGGVRYYALLGLKFGTYSTTVLRLWTGNVISVVFLDLSLDREVSFRDHGLVQLQRSGLEHTSLF